MYVALVCHVLLNVYVGFVVILGIICSFSYHVYCVGSFRGSTLYLLWLSMHYNCCFSIFLSPRILVVALADKGVSIASLTFPLILFTSVFHYPRLLTPISLRCFPLCCLPHTPKQSTQLSVYALPACAASNCLSPIGNSFLEKDFPSLLIFITETCLIYW